MQKQEKTDVNILSISEWVKEDEVCRERRVTATAPFLLSLPLSHNVVMWQKLPQKFRHIQRSQFGPFIKNAMSWFSGIRLKDQNMLKLNVRNSEVAYMSKKEETAVAKNKP